MYVKDKHTFPTKNSFPPRFPPLGFGVKRVRVGVELSFENVVIVDFYIGNQGDVFVSMAV
jgi:hypothetical protein